jgi:prepilin-type processing-associated H-X9-DG protein
MNEEKGDFRWLGNGISGINWPHSQKDFRNAISALVAQEELRAGIQPLDPRGVWSFGQPGGRMTWAHGINGDAYGPSSNQWPRSDDIQGCADLHCAVGIQTLLDNRMRCVDYVDANQQATSHSQHTGGVHVAFGDGHVRFISDAIDPGLWHVLYSCETPADILATEPEINPLACEMTREKLPIRFLMQTPLISSQNQHLPTPSEWNLSGFPPANSPWVCPK